jgi:DNA-directed RNA polymerase specialized sigma24 family protein
MATERGRPRPTEAELFHAADELAAAFRVAAIRSAEIDARIVAVKDLLADGESIAGMVRSGERLTLLEATNETLEALLTAGTRMRRLTAQALYAEGLTMDEIAAALRVTRQRVSKLLSADPEPPGPLWTRHQQG